MTKKLGSKSDNNKLNNKRTSSLKRSNTFKVSFNALIYPFAFLLVFILTNVFSALNDFNVITVYADETPLVVLYDVEYYKDRTNDTNITLDKYDSDGDGTDDTDCVWDISESNDESVMAYLYNNGVLILDGEGEVKNNLVGAGPIGDAESPFTNGCNIMPWRQYHKLESLTYVTASDSGFTPIGYLADYFSFYGDAALTGSTSYYPTIVNPNAIKLTTIDLSKFDTTNVLSFENFFAFNPKLTEIIGIENLDVSSSASFRSMFNGCGALSSLDLSSWIVTDGLIYNYMFAGVGLDTTSGACIDISNWSFKESADLGTMFLDAKLDSLNLSNITGTDNASNYYRLFEGLNISELDLSSISFKDPANLGDLLLRATIDTIVLPYVLDSVWIDRIYLPLSNGEVWYAYNDENHQVNGEIYNHLLENEGSGSDKIYQLKTEPEKVIYTDNDNDIIYNSLGTSDSSVTLVQTYDLTDLTKTEVAGSIMAYLYSDGTMIFTGSGHNLTYSDNTLPYSDKKNSITRIICGGDSSFGPYHNTRYYFNECPNLVTFDGRRYTSSLTNFKGLFLNDAKLKTVMWPDTIDTSKVTEMKEMFKGCSSLTSIDLSKFNTSKVIDMKEMFRGCSSLTSIDLSSFDTSIVTNMDSLFRDCSNVTNIILPNNFGIAATSMYSLFYDCNKLSTVNIEKINTANCTNLNSMFKNCNALSTLDISHFDTSLLSADSAAASMFYGCSSLNSLTLPDTFITSGVNNISYIFYDCRKLTSIDLSGFDTTNVTNMEGAFKNCKKLSTLSFPDTFVTSNCTNFSSMFYGCNALTNLDLSKFDTSSNNTVYSMFKNCTNLETLNLSNFDTTSITNINDEKPEEKFTFEGLSNLTSINLSNANLQNFDTSVNNFTSDLTSLNTIILPSTIKDGLDIELPSIISSFDNYDWYGFDINNEYVGQTPYDKLVVCEGNTNSKLYKLVFGPGPNSNPEPDPDPTPRRKKKKEEVKEEIKEKQQEEVLRPEEVIKEDKPLFDLTNNTSHIKYIDGYEDGTFKPDDGIKRSEFSKMISLVTKNYFEENKLNYISYLDKYNDIDTFEWYASYIGYLT